MQIGCFAWSIAVFFLLWQACIIFSVSHITAAFSTWTLWLVHESAKGCEPLQFPELSRSKDWWAHADQNQFSVSFKALFCLEKIVRLTTKHLFLFLSMPAVEKEYGLCIEGLLLDQRSLVNKIMLCVWHLSDLTIKIAFFLTKKKHSVCLAS